MPETPTPDPTAQLNATPARTSKLLRLDAMRGLAVLLVFVYHLAGISIGWNRFYVAPDFAARDLWPGVPDILYPVTLGWVGVPIFFVLSGFVIHLALGA